jgi:hypothetical protein
MGCICSNSARRHDTEWTFENVSRDRLSGAIQRALLRPPKWQLTQASEPLATNCGLTKTDALSRYGVSWRRIELTTRFSV